MPIYEYKCSACGEQFTTIKFSYNNETETFCPACGSKNVTKMLSSFATSGSSMSFGGHTHTGGGG